MKKGLPIGVSEFRDLRVNDRYYVDKTLLIDEWLQSGAVVTLITRPRRFGKTLVMTMLREFLDITCDSREIFGGLAVMDTPVSYTHLAINSADKGTQDAHAIGRHLTKGRQKAEAKDEHGGD